MVNDAALTWGGDLSYTPTGDIALQSGSLQGQERILRRLLTNNADYIWHTNYGAGLGQFIGDTVNQRQVAGVIRSQLYAEAAVARQPSPSISVSTVNASGVYVNIQYVDASDRVTQVLSFSMEN